MTLRRLQKHIVRITALLMALALLFFVGLYGYRVLCGYNYDGALFEKDLAAGVKADEDITNIALFGLDTREGDIQSHSDSIMIATVDNTRGKLKLTSLMRDSLVEIDGHGSDKLNAAYFLGGPALAIRTINENFGTDIRDYVAVEFGQLVQIVDTLDGIEIDVQDYELNELNRVITDYGKEQGTEFKLVDKAGTQKLNGVQALCYGRIRKNNTGDDWGRVERQSIVLDAMFSKLQKLSVNRMLMLMYKLMPYVTCSLAPAELAPLVVGALKNGMPTLEHTRIPVDGEWEYYGQSGEYILFDTDVAAEHIRRYIYEDVTPGETVPTDSTGTAGSDDNTSTSTGSTGSEESPEEPSESSWENEEENISDNDNGDVGEEYEDPEPDFTEDPSDLAEEGGRYDPETGDYYDSDGDRYYLDDNGDRVYY